jgi:hypothetical protein
MDTAEWPEMSAKQLTIRVDTLTATQPSAYGNFRVSEAAGVPRASC